jgi:hypothetical protein
MEYLLSWIYWIYSVLASTGISFFLFYKIRVKNDALIQEKLISRNYPIIILIINIINLCTIVIVQSFFPEKLDDLTGPIILFTILTYGALLILCILIYLFLLYTAIYYIVFLMPLSVGSIVFTILRKNYLTKNNMIFIISINSLVIVINLFLYIYFFLPFMDTFIHNSKEFIGMILGFINILTGSYLR